MPEEFGTAELVREFLEEAEEHFAVLNRDLLAIETSLSAFEEVPSEQLDEMFRAVHTLKGLSAMFDLNGIKDLAHKVENVFDRMRKRTLTPDAGCLDMLFSSVDVLQRAVASFEHGESELPELFEATDRVVMFLESDARIAAPVVDVASDRLSEYARARLMRAAAEGLHGIRIRLRWGIELRLGMLRVRDVEVALGAAGEVLDIQPVLGELQEIDQLHPSLSDLSLDVVALASATDQDVADSLGVSRGAIAPIACADTPEMPAAVADAIPVAAGPEPDGGATASAVRTANVVRVDIRRLDELVELTGELVTARTTLQELSVTLVARHPKDETVNALRQVIRETSTLINGLQESVMGLRMVPIGHVFAKLPRVVRDLVRSTGKSIRLDVTGGETELDKRVIEQVEDPLMHILRNACDHGIETPEARIAAGKPVEGVVRLSAWYEGGDAVVACTDDGRGLDIEKIVTRALASGGLTETEMPTPERIAEIIMAPGFSTAETITQVSGRGVGLDVVRRKTMELGGRVEVTSEVGVGTTFTLRLPLTMAIIPALIVWASGRRFAVPLSAVSGVLRVRPDAISRVHGVEVIDLHGETLPLLRLHDVLGLEGARAEGRVFVVEAVAVGQRFGLGVDRLVGQQEIVVKSIEEAVGVTEGVSGATILGDGTVVPILDIEGIVRLRERTRGRSHGSSVAGGVE